MANRSSGQGPIPIRTANPNSRHATANTTTTTDLPLRSLLTKLTTLISTCYSLCHTIRSNRRLSSSGSATVSLSALEVSLSDALPRLSNLYASLRASHGAAFDIADSTSLNALEASVNVLSNDIKARLSDVADSRAGSKTKSGFKDIRATFTTCMTDAEDTLGALSARLSAASAPPPAPRPIAPAPRSRRESRVRESEAPRVLEKDEIAITYRQFERMDAIMRMCWEEEAAEGGRRFRNVADPSRVVYGVVPEGGFVRALQR